MNRSIYGIDTDAGIRHTGGCQALYLRFLKRFPEDPSYSQLASALKDGCFEDAYIHAHTLKGLCAQLGITALMSPAERLCAMLKSGDLQSLVMAKNVLDEMVPLYEAIVREIASLS